MKEKANKFKIDYMPPKMFLEAISRCNPDFITLKCSQPRLDDYKPNKYYTIVTLKMLSDLIIDDANFKGHKMSLIVGGLDRLSDDTYSIRDTKPMFNLFKSALGNYRGSKLRGNTIRFTLNELSGMFDGYIIQHSTARLVKGRGYSYYKLGRCN